MRKFEVVQAYKDKDINLPKRSTNLAAGYDLEAAEDVTIPSFLKMSGAVVSGALSLDDAINYNKANSEKATLVPTGLKVYCEPNEYVALVMRSSIASKARLIMPNAPATVDADYVDNPDNEGHIYIPIINLNPYPVKIKKGERIAQAIFHSYLTVDNEGFAASARAGGFGSTGV